MSKKSETIDLETLKLENERQLALHVLRWIYYIEPSRDEIKLAIEKLEQLLKQ